MKLIKTLLSFALVMLVVACSKEGKKRMADYSIIQKELNLDSETSTTFKAITDKYDESRKSFRATLGEHPDRVTLFSKYEEFQASQDGEVAKILTPEQMAKYSKFVDENTRKRPRYNNATLALIQSEAQLDESQMQVVNAANDAFEKSYSDAHDLYHGNPELGKEYWTKFDAQRKAAIESVLSPEQKAAYTEVVKDISNTSKK
ncbi:hypothetical protein [Chryseobacterium sp. A301]